MTLRGQLCSYHWWNLHRCRWLRPWPSRILYFRWFECCPPWDPTNASRNHLLHRRRCRPHHLLRKTEHQRQNLQQLHKKTDHRPFSHENRPLCVAIFDGKWKIDSWGFFHKKIPTGKSIPVQVAQSGQRDAETRPSALPPWCESPAGRDCRPSKDDFGSGKHWKTKAMTETSPQNVTKVN